MHPHYQRRGFGADLARWGVELASLEGYAQGVHATKVGQKVYKQVGFEEVGTLVNSDPGSGESFEQMMLVYQPSDVPNLHPAAGPETLRRSVRLKRRILRLKK